jgi:hypothetical protein
MRSPLLAITCGLTLLVAIIGSGWSARVERLSPDDSALLDEIGLPARALLGLPDGFTTSLDPVTTHRIVRVVADDIDRDGDIDVLANVGSLDLVVWRNDGAGRFSLVPSARRHQLLANGSQPALDGNVDASFETVQTDEDGRAVRFIRLDGALAASPRIVLAAPIDAAVPQTRPSVRSPRAPPRTVPL